MTEAQQPVDFNETMDAATFNKIREVDPQQAEALAAGAVIGQAIEGVTARFIDFDTSRRKAFLDGVAFATFGMRRVACNMAANGMPNASVSLSRIAGSIDAGAIHINGIRKPKKRRVLRGRG